MLLTMVIWRRGWGVGGRARGDTSFWNGGEADFAIHHSAETSRHIAGSDVTPEISTNNLYADVGAASPTRARALSSTIYILLVYMYVCMCAASHQLLSLRLRNNKL